MADTYWPLHKAPPSSPKKWAVRVPTSSGRGKTVLFGARGYEDFTTHGDVERRERYRIRHQHDRIDDPYAPGFWSMWALWGESDDLKTAFAAAVRKAKKIARRNPSPISTAVDGEIQGARMRTPTIHTNGSSPEHLLKGLKEAYRAVGIAMRALDEAAPNGRDYYPQGHNAVEEATREHQFRAVRLRSVREELEELVISVQTQKNERERRNR